MNNTFYHCKEFGGMILICCLRFHRGIRHKMEGEERDWIKRLFVAVDVKTKKLFAL